MDSHGVAPVRRDPKLRWIDGAFPPFVNSCGQQIACSHETRLPNGSGWQFAIGEYPVGSVLAIDLRQVVGLPDKDEGNPCFPHDLFRGWCPAYMKQRPENRPAT